MRRVIAAGAATMPSTCAVAQTSGSGASRVPPVVSPQGIGAIQSGANSFTERQARSRTEAQGFAHVADLRRDDQGIWRGRATRNGRSVGAMLDFCGSVASQ
ncbi:PepSY domain-containing protein [Microvirga sp. GCM10011540]|uniref:PepSY domain-containing protein n=1 Tax=Microvirga sp. GCM10011540 TaxID=3317338 RepID=UPI00360B09A6